MTDLRDRLRAEIQRRREIAQAATPGPWERQTGSHSNVVRPAAGFEWVGVAGRRLDVPVFTGQTSNRDREQWEADATHIAANDPTTVLRRLAADERILDLHTMDGHGPIHPGAGDPIDAEAWCEAGCALTDDGECPTVLALAEGYGVPPYEPATTATGVAYTQDRTGPLRRFPPPPDTDGPHT